jgi:hypothetical protein
MVSHDFFEGFWYSTFSLQPIVYSPDLKKILNFVNQNNNEVKNNKKQASDRIEPLKIKESNNNFNSAGAVCGSIRQGLSKNLTGQTNIILSKDGTKKAPDIQVKKPELNDGQTHYPYNLMVKLLYGCGLRLF